MLLNLSLFVKLGHDLFGSAWSLLSVAGNQFKHILDIICWYSPVQWYFISIVANIWRLSCCFSWVINC